MAISIHIDDHTRDVERVVEEKIKTALGLMGEVVERYAKEECPVDTGRLRNSLTHEAGQDNGDICEYVGSAVEYAPFVEYIERFHHPVGKAHFLRDAGQDHISELREVAAASLANIES